MGKAVKEDREDLYPHNIEAEVAVLGAVLVNNDLWPTAAAIVLSGDFYRSAHGDIWSSMERVRASGAAIDIVTLSNDLERHGALERIGGKPYIFKLLDGVPKSTNIEHYARIVKEKARLRGLVDTGNKLLADAYHSEMSSPQIIESAMAELLRHTAPDGDGTIEIGPAVAAYVESLDDPTAHVPVPTGFADIDHMLDGGLKSKDVVIVAARPGVGKTSWATCVAVSVAKQGEGAAIFSMEMSRDGIVGRIVSGESKVPRSKMTSGNLTPEEGLRIADVIELTESLPLYIVDNATSLPQIFSWCYQLKQRPGGLRMVVVDYIQLMYAVGRKFESREKEIAYISSEFRRMAKELDVVFMILSQLSRSPEGRKDKRPQLADLRESGALEQDAAVVILLYREEMHEPTDENRNIAEAIFAKNRDGSLGVQRLYFAKETSWFRDLAI